MKVSLQALGMETAAALLALAIIAAIAFAQARRPLDRDQLAVQVSALKSQASEAQMLVDALREDRVTPKFARMHAQQMRESANRIDKKLDKAVNPSIAEPWQQTRRMASQLEDALRLLASDRRNSIDKDHEPTTVSFAPLATRLDALHSQLKSPESADR